ncbi:hypothetical protein OCH239_09320 [Roseivivax halodurans JCM 10272]|uniref:Uncharacterized protein n=1 Tax=Roseivivax halodurans JCM 10272 TaxID=1449350 RepID=X7ECN6_9RHOB|nr:hypothetical protein [Roseivivax halodurans]ETX13655.1 hypothetical protein OCH239_09320 [Roseivivax halodurans JCM 10272]
MSNQYLVFRHCGDADGRLQLVTRTHDLGGTDYDPIFRASVADAYGIGRANRAVGFHTGDDEGARASAEPMALRAVRRSTRQTRPWDLLKVSGEMRKLAELSDDQLSRLRKGVSLDVVDTDALPRFYLVRSEAGDRTLLEEDASTDVKAAIRALQTANGGRLLGEHHLEDVLGERIEVILPAHGKRNWSDGDYASNCAACGHAFLGPKRAPRCAPCHAETLAENAARDAAGPAAKPGRHGVYIASKAVAHGPRWQELRKRLPVISTWIDESAPGLTLDWPDLWDRCISEVISAEVLIVYMEPGETLKGAWIEVGAALGAGVPVLGVGIDEFSIAKSGKITLCASMDEAVEMARGIMDGNALVHGAGELESA